MYRYRTWELGDEAWLDTAAVLAAWESLSDEERAFAHPAGVAEQARTEWRETLGSPWGTAYLALYGQQPVGFILAALSRDGTTGEANGNLLSLWVMPAHRHRGVARQLWQLAESACVQAGLRKVKIWTGIHNKGAVRLALSGGYKPEGLIGMKEL